MISRYVDNKELKRIIEDGNLKTYKIKKVLKEQGILLACSNPEQIAEQVYPIFWGSKDIYNIRNSVDDSSNYIKSSVMELYSNDSDSILDDLQDYFNQGCYRHPKFALATMKTVGDSKLFVKLRYNVNKLGRNELISEQKRDIEIIVEKSSDKKVTLDIRQASAYELKEINKFLQDASSKMQDIKANHLSLEKFTKDNKILFFDEFNKHSFKGWRFTTVTKVELKKDEDITEIDSEENESIASLQGITNAILSGTSIRNNSFVQECIKNQFSVVTMGYKFENISDSKEVIIEVNFKHDDMRIDICKTYEFDSDEGKVKLHPLILPEQEEIIDMFQKAAYRVFNDLLQKQLAGI